MRLDAWLSMTGRTQADLARELDTTAATVNRIVTGKQNIPLSMADKIAVVTSGAVTAEDLRAAFANARAA